MKINKLRIMDMYGIKGDKEYDLSPRIVGLFGKNGIGKSSVINSLKFAIGGEKRSTTMLCGSNKSAVRIQTDSVTIDRMLTRTETGSMITSWLDGKKMPGNRVQVELASQLKTTKDNLKILSSKDIEDSLADNAGKILLSFADNELSSSEVKDLLYNEVKDSGNFDKERIKDIPFPEHITWQAAEDIASAYRKSTKNLRSEIKGMEASFSAIRLMDFGDTEVPSVEDAENEYNVLVKKEALYKEGQKLLVNYEKINNHREKSLKMIEVKEAELKKYENTIDLADAKDKQAKIIEKGNELREKISSCKATISALQPLYEKMGTGICPLSCDGVEIKCCTDMSDTKASIKKQIDDAETSIKTYMQEMTEAKKEYDKILSDISMAEKKAKLLTEIESMKKAIPEQTEKPNVSEFQNIDVQRKNFLMNVLKNAELSERQKTLAKQINEKKKVFYLNDFVCKQFSQNGVISMNLLGKYIDTLNEAALKSEQDTGVKVVFKNDNGISIGYSVRDEVEREYESLSDGEKMLAFLTVSDLLHRIANIPVLLLDNVDKLDADNFDRMLTLIERVSDSYENIILAGVGHDDFKSVLQKHNIVNIIE